MIAVLRGTEQQVFDGTFKDNEEKPIQLPLSLKHPATSKLETNVKKSWPLWLCENMLTVEVCAKCGCPSLCCPPPSPFFLKSVSRCCNRKQEGRDPLQPSSISSFPFHFSLKMEFVWEVDEVGVKVKGQKHSEMLMGLRIGSLGSLTEVQKHTGATRPASLC